MRLEAHCAISKDRTGFDFKDLHQWIDEAQKKKGVNHRAKKHFFNTKDANEIKRYWNKERGTGWGEKAIQEWLFHIALDNLDTAFKMQNRKKE